MKIEGTAEHTSPEGKVGGGPRVANRGGIFKVKFSKANKVDQWIVPVKEKPGQWNVAVGIETTGPGEDDKGFVKSSWHLISGQFSDKSKRPGQSRLGMVHDLLLSVGLKPAAVKKAVPLKGTADLDKIEKLLDKYLEGKEGFAQLLDKKQQAYKGEVHWASEVIAYIAKETAEGLIATNSHESPLSVGAKEYAKKGATSVEDDENFEDDVDPASDDEDVGDDLKDDDDDDFGDDDDDDFPEDDDDL